MVSFTGPGHGAGALVLVALLCITSFQSFALVSRDAAGDAGDWGETVGNVTFEKAWGYGSGVNITTDNVTLAGGSYGLDTTTGFVSMGALDLVAGTRDNVSLRSANTTLALRQVAPNWSLMSMWNIPMIDLSLAAPTLGDIDNDGDLDAYVGMSDGATAGYENTGSSTSPSWAQKNIWNHTFVADFATPCFGDLDDDGDLDLMVGDDGGITYGFENTGNKTNATWTARTAWNTGDSGTGAAPALGDLDGDGDLDVMVGISAGSTLGYRNTGSKSSPTFARRAAWDIGDYGAIVTPALGDLDEDGDLDLLLGETGGSTYGFNNTGSTSSPTWTRQNSWDIGDIGVATSPKFADIDADGDLDAFLGEQMGVSYGVENRGWRAVNGSFLSLALDAGKVVNWSQISWTEVMPANTGVTFYTRAGNSTNPGDPTWDSWSVQLSTPAGTAIPSKPARYIQVRVVLDTTNGLLTPSVSTINVTYWNYKPSGVLTTDDLTPSALIRWLNVTNTNLPHGESIVISYSLNGGVDWTVIPGDGNMSGVSNSSGKIRFKVAFTTVHPEVTPEFIGLRLVYMSLLAPHHVHLKPTDTTVAAGGTVNLTAELHDINNNTIAAAAVWTTDIGSVSTSGNVTGLTTVGDGNVTVTFGALSAKAHITVVPGPVARISVAPTDIGAMEGTSAAFSASAFDAYNNSVTGVTFNWSTTVGTLSAATGTGTMFTAKALSGHPFPVNETGTVTAAIGSVAGAGNVTVYGLILSLLSISPTDISLMTGQTHLFEASGKDQFGASMNVTAAWSSSVGTMAPATGRNSTLTPSVASGMGTVTATVGNLAAIANVTVVGKTLTSISISPASVTLLGGQTQVFAVSGLDQFGSALNVTADWSSTVGTMSPAAGGNSTFTPNVASGKGTVTATVGTLSAVANVTVVGAVLTSISIAPASVTMLAGQTQVFKVSGLDQFGGAMNISGNWSSTIGSMSPSHGQVSVLTPFGSEGNGTVTATVGELSATADVTVKVDQTYPYPKVVGKIPDKTVTEDSPPWVMDLNPFEGGGTGDGELMWYIDGEDNTLVKVMGEYDASDMLTFIPLPDMSGSMQVTYVLVDKLGYAASQKAWIHITPVDDPPSINPAPDLQVRYDAPYTFNYLPYISDKDTQVSGLKLAVIGVEPMDKPLEVRVNGFNITYTGPKSLLGQSMAVTIAVSDETSTIKESVTVMVTENWVPELLKPLPDVTLNEGELKEAVFDLDDYFNDQDNDMLFFTYGNNHVNITIDNDHTVDILAQNEWSGQELVTFRATDAKGALLEDDVHITVIPLDDAPTIDPIPDIVVHYDMKFEMDLSPYVHDVDTKTERLTLSFSDSHVWWSWDPARVVLDPPDPGVAFLTMGMDFPETLGSLEMPYTIPVTVKVSDGTNKAERSVNIKVTDDMPPEVISFIPDVEFQEDASLNDALQVSAYFRDCDGDPLTYTALSHTVKVTIASDWSVDFSAPRDWFGTDTVTFRATDPDGAVVEDSIIVSVLPVNDAPVLGIIMGQDMVESNIKTISLRNTTWDVDNNVDQLSVDVNTSASGLRAFVSGTDIVLYADAAGDYEVTVTVVDPSGAKATGTFNVRVTAMDKAEPTTRSANFMDLWPYLLLLVIIIGSVLGFAGYRRNYGSYTCEEVFVIVKDGRLLSHVSRHPVSKKDKTIFSGMVAAIQLFVEDAFVDIDAAKGSTVQRMDYKGNTIIIEHGKWMYLAVLIKGTPGKKLLRDMNDAVKDIEEKHGQAIAEWDGDRDAFGDLPEHLVEFIPRGFITGMDNRK